MKRYIWIILFVCLAMTYAMAHNYPNLATPYPGVQESKTQIGQAEIKHDQKTDEASVSTAIQLIGKLKKNELNLDADYKVTGKKISTIKGVILTFSTVSSFLPDCEHQASEKLLFIIDGVKYEVGEMYAVILTKLPKNKGCIRIRSQSVSWENFIKLLDAKQVEGQLGETMFEFKPEHLEALRDMRKYIQQ